MIVLSEQALVSQSVCRYLQGFHQGEILLVTSRGVYLSFPERILMLTEETYGLVPIGIGLQRCAAVLARLKLQTGQPVCLQAGQLTFSGGCLTLEIQEVTQRSTFPAPLPNRITEAAGLLWEMHNPKGVAGLSRPLLLGRDADLTPLCQVALPLLKKLLETLESGHRSHIEQIVAQLIGLGIGLTPSMDDVLLGMLYALLRWRDDRASALKEAILTQAPKGTHPISAAYLLAVADGEPFQRLDDVLSSLATQTPLDISPILEIGSSSGSEMLLGLLLAAKHNTQKGDALWDFLH